jgi:predicted AlkP superfamily pyrophosphatase or phosphodiesterase
MPIPRALVCLALALCWPGPAAAERSAEHLVLVSIDGLRPDFYLDDGWPAPMLQRRAREGAHARRIRGVFPSVTYPSHTTILTGALPARHGIHYNSPFEPTGQTGRWHWESDGIRVPTLWQAARAAGLATANVNWPVSVGAPVDHNLPEVWSLDPETDPLGPMRQLSAPPGLVEELEREATGRLTASNFHIDQLTRDDRAGDIAAYLLETYRPGLLTVHLIETDHFQHDEGRSGPTVTLAVAAADRALAQMVEAAARAGILERTAFIVTGDHGHTNRHTRLAPNVWLAGAGLLEARPDRGRWRAAFHTSGAAAFLHLADPDDEAAVAAVRRLLADQPGRIRKLFRVVERDELDRLGAAPEAVLALAPVPGVDLSRSAEPPLLQRATGATHGYLPDEPEMHTGLVLWGAGVEPGASAERLGMEQIAPLAAALLDLDFTAPDGVLPAGLLAPLPESP